MASKDRPLSARALALTTALAQGSNDVASMNAFSRVNPRLLPDTQIEIDVPGSSSVLSCYRVSALSDSGVESARSPVALFAVPRRALPPPPKLLLRSISGTRVERFATRSWFVA